MLAALEVICFLLLLEDNRAYTTTNFGRRVNNPPVFCAMRTIVVTGGVGCGKSLLAKALGDELGIQSVLPFSADAVVHDLYKCREVRRKIGNALGIEPRQHDVADDVFRKLVRDVVVSNSGARLCLEQILHPLVWDAYRQISSKPEAPVNKVLLAEIPLYYETDGPIAVDLVVVVAASEATQIHRLRHFRSIEKVVAKEMLGMQLPLETKVQRADLVIWNDGSLEDLRAQSVVLAKLIERKYFNLWDK